MKKSQCGLKPINTPSWDPMSSACDAHDEFYIKNKLHGGEELRELGDKQFDEDMKAIIRSKPFYLRPILEVQRIIYFTIVRLVGWKPWANKSNGV